MMIRKIQLILLLTLAFTPLWHVAKAQDKAQDIFARNNLVAWCIVPFDGKKRGPAERAAMCAKLGLKKIAYDWRQEHVATFEQEILEYKKHGLNYFAFWDVHEEAFKLFEKYKLSPQVWYMIPPPGKGTQEQRIKQAAEACLPTIAQAKKIGSKVGLYNHGGWAGDPPNMVAVCKYLKEHHKIDNVGIVYNQHHCHPRVDLFEKDLKAMLPHLLCLNLNGTTREGDKKGMKILPLGEGELDLSLLKIIRSSGYSGPIGIIGHTQDDVELRLRDNLNGLEWLRPQLDGKPATPKPTPVTWSPEDNTSLPVRRNGVLVENNPRNRVPAITVEARVTLPSKANYNILLASDTKQSLRHWELFSMPSTGKFTLYATGLRPDHVRADVDIADGKPHTIGMIYEEKLIRLFVDGKQVASQPVEMIAGDGLPGKLGIGRLVSGNLGCSGPVDWVRIRRGSGLPWSQHSLPPDAGPTIIRWLPSDAKNTQTKPDSIGKTPEYDADLVSEILENVVQRGNAGQGMVNFANSKTACINCHRIGSVGGTVGPALTKLALDRKPHEIVASVLWPKRKIEDKYKAHAFITADGDTLSGYVLERNEKRVLLRDPTKGTDHQIELALDDIDAEREVGTLMPENLIGAMTYAQVYDLVRFLLDLGKSEEIPLAEVETVLEYATAHVHGAAEFTYDNQPLASSRHIYFEHPINRDREYDFYAKESEFFRQMLLDGERVPPVLMSFNGLDGGEQGHWGNQDEETWKRDAWNHVDLGRVLSGVFRGGGVTVNRGIAVRLGDEGELACVFNPETLSYDMVWKSGFIKFRNIRHGFLDGIPMDGTAVAFPEKGLTAEGKKLAGSMQYHGLYRSGQRVYFQYTLNGKTYLDSPWVQDGRFVREVQLKEGPLSAELSNGVGESGPQVFTSKITHGNDGPYAIDTFELPLDNPWKVPVMGSAIAMLPDGAALLATMHGDVWKVEELEFPSKEARWTRFASGLHQPLGMIADEDGIFVLCRDQIVRLWDTDENGEADFYECFSNQHQTSSGGHDYICGLERDADGNFYTASGADGVYKISADGRTAEVIATGFRNPDGIGLTPDGVLTIPCAEGGWTPSSMICAMKLEDDSVPHFGFRGPKGDAIPNLPLVYLPRGLDNQSGGQQTVTSDRWGPLNGQLLHFSFGTGNHFLILKDEVDGQLQGAVVRLPGDFLSGIHRGRFSPKDGQLYVTGMQGWGCYTPEDGCFQRVRYTGDSVQVPTSFRVHKNGIKLTFAQRPDKALVEQAESHFAMTWNYRYGAQYGSPEYSTRHLGMIGHDYLPIKSAHVIDDGKSVFLEIPDIQPANQIHLRVQTAPGVFSEMFVTAHKLDQHSFVDAPGLVALDNKPVNPHPIINDIALATKVVPNPFASVIADARPITLQAGSNLSFATKIIRAKAGEMLALTFDNPDVVPHNWALLKPGTLQRVGNLANQLISDPEAAIKQYVPDSSDVIVFTDIVLPKQQFTIYFKVPEQPGRYPYLCTFPGHWLVMNGNLIVE
ncbi:plastocyanin/azurin family copper-binding protein [Pirellulaceae bacterium]|nr:plastocyanin/azurin family copper-binding protein [Pirellulaceae bacterium]